MNRTIAACGAEASKQLHELLNDKLVAMVTDRDLLGLPSIARLECRGVLVLGRSRHHTEALPFGFSWKKLDRAKQIYTNNCQVAILDRMQASLFTRKYKFRRLRHVLCRANLNFLVAIPLTIAHILTGRLAFEGMVNIDTQIGRIRYLVFRNRQSNKDHRRQYLPSDRTPLEGLSSLSDLPLITLRNQAQIRDGSLQGDVDVLVASTHVKEAIHRLNQHIGTRPLDLYSEDGTQGFNFKGAAYYAPPVAKRIIASSSLDECGIRSPDPLWQYLSYAYHLLFHGKLRPGFLDKPLASSAFRSAHHFHQIRKLAECAGKPAPHSVEALFDVLATAQALPSLDLIWFYAKDDDFLREWLNRRPMPPAGLATFFVRDFGQGEGSTEIVRRFLAGAFHILHDAPLDGKSLDAAISNVRGGNWHDRTAKSGFAPPIHWFIVWDANPERPGFFARRKWPNLDNSKVLLKGLIREQLSKDLGKTLRMVHSSDNTTEAISHICSIDFEKRRALIQELGTLGISEKYFGRFTTSSQ